MALRNLKVSGFSNYDNADIKYAPSGFMADVTLNQVKILSDYELKNFEIFKKSLEGTGSFQIFLNDIHIKIGGKIVTTSRTSIQIKNLNVRASLSVSINISGILNEALSGKVSKILTDFVNKKLAENLQPTLDKLSPYYEKYINSRLAYFMSFNSN